MSGNAMSSGNAMKSATAMKALLWILTGLAVALAGCAAGPNYHTPQPDTPPAFVAITAANTAASASATATANAPDLATWWRALDDPELDSLVERAIKSNPDLEIALTRLQQARNYEAVVAGHALPDVDASGAAARGTGNDLTKG